jgi:hypothetical protein
MNTDSIRQRVKAYRVTDHREGDFSKWIVIEDVERAQFRTGARKVPSPIGAIKEEEDKKDAWNALNSISDSALYTNWLLSDSIDDAIAEGEAIRQDFLDAQQREEKRRRMNEQPARSDRINPDDRRPRQATGPIPILSSRDEAAERLMQPMWDFAGNKRLEWKTAGCTPAGRHIEVLTFDGHEEVLVSETGVEIPRQR